MMIKKAIRCLLAAAFMGDAAFAVSNFTLSSPAFEDRSMIPADFTCSGQNVSPEISWANPPMNTRSFALVLIDLSAPSGKEIVHWLVYNIAGESEQLVQHQIKSEMLPNNSMQGINYLGNVGYDGPCPPLGEKHTYVFTLYALDALLDIGPKRTYADLQKAMAGHILGKASLSCFYKKPSEPKPT